MTDQIKSQVSAYLDDELLEAESELLVRRLCTDNELRRTAARYALIGGVLRGSLEATGHDLSARILEAIDADPDTPAPQPVARRRRIDWMRPALGGAIAATVAAVAVFLVREPVSSPTATQPAAVATIAEPDAPSYTVPTRVAVPASANTDRLNQYLVRHSQYATTMAGQGIMTFRTVGYDSAGVPPAGDAENEPR